MNNKKRIKYNLDYSIQNKQIKLPCEIDHKKNFEQSEEIGNINQIKEEVNKNKKIMQGTEEWHHFRFSHCCSSEMLTLLQLNSRQEFEELLIRKILKEKSINTKEQEEFFNYGHEHEKDAAKRHLQFIEKFSFPYFEKYIEVKYSLPIIEHKKDLVMAASLDGIIIYENKRMFLEFKTRPSGRPYDKINISHYLQTQQILYVMNSDVNEKRIMEEGHLVIWFEKDIHLKKGFSDNPHKEYIKIYKIKRDPHLWDVIIQNKIEKVKHIINQIRIIEKEEEDTKSNSFINQIKEECSFDQKETQSYTKKEDIHDIEKEIIKKYIAKKINPLDVTEKKSLFSSIYKSIRENTELICEKMEFD